ncbi:hypothetical protein MLD38_033202 [Melastoma candidum]|uniref:Uncharacterized protein n=1 Tax=Melastoma candidum TaxID=119954 RepID=A0ACB9M823_9MYRT|nr:hypothetical protein MLD38_033202 [Melastoma candidum]
MKLINFKSLSLSPKRLFRSRRSGRSSPSSNHLDGSFSSTTTTSSSSSSSASAPVLTRRDLEALLGRLGAGACSQDEVEAMLRDIGLGVEDGVCIDELVGRLGAVCGGGGKEEELRQAFEFFDEDGDGRITAEELLGVMGGVMGDEGCTLEDCRRMIAGVDGNRDGFVCFEDFTRMMQLQIGA